MFFDGLSRVEVFFALFSVFMGAWVQSITGFGLAIVCVPFLLFIDPVLAPVPVILAAWVQPGMMLFQYYRHIDFPAIALAITGRIPGTLVALYLLLFLSADRLSIVIGFLILFAVSLSFSGRTFVYSRKNIFFASVLSGFMGTASGIGGPPVALVLRHQEGNRIRGFLALYFFLGSMISIIGLAMVGKIHTREISLAMLFIPVIFLGTKFGSAFVRYREIKWLPLAILSLCFFAGLSVIIRYLFF